MAETRSFRFANFGRSLLAAGISAGATQMRLTTDTGVRFPAIDPTYDEIFTCTLFHPSSDDIWEVVYVTQVATDVFTIERGKEGSVARAFDAGARVVHGPTAGFFEQVLAVEPPAETSLLLREDGGRFLLEDGSGFIALE